MSDGSDTESIFEPPAWDERYSGEGSIWSGEPNLQLGAEAADLTPGTHSTSAAARVATWSGSPAAAGPSPAPTSSAAGLARAARAPGGHLLVVGHAPRGVVRR